MLQIWHTAKWTSNFINDLGWRNFQNESCRSQKVMKVCGFQFFLKSFRLPKLRLNFSNLKSIFFEVPSDGETAKIKVVDLKMLWNFVVDNFLIWNHLVIENYIWISQIWNSNFVINNLEWGNSQNKSCISQKVMKFCSWQLFYLNSFRTLNKQFALGLV